MNQNFILQKFKQAILPPMGLISDCGVLKAILSELNQQSDTGYHALYGRALERHCPKY